MLDDYAGQSNLLDEADLDEAGYYARLVQKLLGPAEGGEDVEGCASPALAVVLALRALGCTPPRDPVIEEHLLPRVRELVADPAGCPAFAVLVEDLAPVLPPEDVREAAWPRPSDWTPRWGAPRVDCETLGATLWRRALGE